MEGTTESFLSLIEGHERLPAEPEVEDAEDLVLNAELRDLLVGLEFSEDVLREFTFRVRLVSLRDLSIAIGWDAADWVSQLGPRAAVRLREATYMMSRLANIPGLSELLVEQNTPIVLSSADKLAVARDVHNHYEFQKWERRLRKALRKEIDVWSSTASAITPIPDEVSLMPITDRGERGNTPHERAPSMERIMDDVDSATTGTLRPPGPQVEEEDNRDSESDSYNEEGDICNPRKRTLHLLLVLNVLSIFLLMRFVIRVPPPKEPYDPDWTQMGQEIGSFVEGAATFNGTDGQPIRFPGDRFGWSVAISSDTEMVAIGSPGNSSDVFGSAHAYEFDYIEKRWIKAANVLQGEGPGDRFGFSVAVSDSGTIIAVGSPGWKRGAGRAYIFQRRRDKWELLGKPIEGKAPGDGLGFALALSSGGDIVAVGASQSDAPETDSGTAQVYQYNGNQWEQLGQTLAGLEKFDRFGYAVDLSHNGYTLAVGAPYHKKDPQNEDWWEGQTQVFRYKADANRWVIFGQPLTGRFPMDRFGWSVQLSTNGQILVVGSPWNQENGEASGQVRAFRYNSESGLWVQRGNPIQGPDLGRWFGNTVMISRDGHTVCTALWGDHPFQPVLQSGGVRVYRFDAFTDEWSQVGGDLPGKTFYDPISSTVAMSGDGTIIMATKNSGQDTGTVRAYTPSRT